MQPQEALFPQDERSETAESEEEETVAVISGPPTGDDGVELVPLGDAPEESVPQLAPMLSHTHGLYDEPFLLELSSPTGTGQLRYTLDGSDPLGDEGRLYIEPLEVETTTVLRAALTLDGETALIHESATYLFPAAVPDQRAPDAYPDEWWEDETGGPYEADYEMDPDVIESDTWEEHAPALFSDLPVVSVLMDPEDLFGEDGIYENPEEKDDDERAEGGEDEWERAASVAMFDATNGTIFTVDCGIQLQGASSRMPDRTPKKSFRLVFKSRFGPGRLDAPVFEGSPVEDFNTLVLRSFYNNAWSNWSPDQRLRAQYIREAFASYVHRQMGDAAPHARPVHLFLNGLYWGLYLVQERPDSEFMASYYGGDDEAWDAINAGEVVDGDVDAWEGLMDDVKEDLSNLDDYLDVAEELDIDRFIDYMLLELTLGNVDWPDRNWWAARRRDDGLWFFVAWDNEYIMGVEDRDLLDVDAENSPGELFQALRETEEFRVRFGDRIQKHLFHGGALTEASLLATWEEHSARVVPAVVAESARWGDHWRDSRDDDEAELYTYEEHWQDERERILEEWMPNRIGIVLEQYQDADLYPDVPAPELAPLGGVVSRDEEIALDAEDGDVYYTLDGTDPREEGGEIDDDAILYIRPFTLDGDATLKARAWSDGEWSALVEVEFEVE